MADLKIKLTVDSKQYEDLVNKMKGGNITLKEMSELKRAVNAAFREAIPGTQQYKELEQVLAKINDRQRDVRLSTRAGNEAYFKAGLELRQLMLANFKFEGSLGKVSDALNNSVGAAIGFKAALVPLGISMGGVGLAFVAVAAFLPTLIKLFGETTTAAERLEKQFGTTEERLRRYIKEGTRSDIKELVEAAYNEGKISAAAWAEFRRALAIQAGKERAAAKKKEQIEEVKNEKELFDLAVARHNLNRVIAADAAFDEKQAATRAKIFGAPSGPAVTGIKGVKVGEAIRQDIKLTFGEALSHTRAFQHAFLSAGSIMAQGISSQIGGAFSKVFGGAHTMLGQFAAAFASTLADILLQLGIRAGLTAIGLPVGFASGGIIPEPVIGRGLQSGRMYSFGERGPERVGPNVNQIGQASRFGSGGGRDGNVFVVENRITDTGLSTFVRRGDRKLTKRSY